MFRTMLPSTDCTQAKTHYHASGMCYLNANGTPSTPQPQADTIHMSQREALYPALARSIEALAGKAQRMSRPSPQAPALSEPAFAALHALRSANDVWHEREPAQGGSHATPGDAVVWSAQQATQAYCSHRWTQHTHSITSQNESVSGTEESSPLSHDEDDVSTSSTHSTLNTKSCILRDLQRLLKRERSASQSVAAQAATPNEEACDADDAVSESGVLDYSTVCERCAETHEAEVEQRPFKLYRDEEDRAALIEELFRQEDEDALIQRIFSGRSGRARAGRSEGHAGS